MSELNDDPVNVEFDLHAIEPHEVARLMVTRAFGDAMGWAEILHDARRYERTPTVVVHLVGFCEQLLSEIGKRDGRSSADVWRSIMLAEREVTDDV